MNMIFNKSDLVGYEAVDRTNAKKEALAKIVAAWESKQIKNAARFGGLGFLAVSLAACNSSSDDTTTTTPTTWLLQFLDVSTKIKERGMDSTPSRNGWRNTIMNTLVQASTNISGTILEKNLCGGTPIRLTSPGTLPTICLKTLSEAMRK